MKTLAKVGYICKCGSTNVQEQDRFYIKCLECKFVNSKTKTKKNA